MNEAIKRAIEGGRLEGGKFNELDPFLCDVHMYHSDGTADSICRYEMLLDPLFWQALGKAEKWWKDIKELKCNGCDFKATNANYVFCPKDSSLLEIIETPIPQCRSHWITNWHHFIDHIASGGDIDSFFTALLTKGEGK